MRWIESQPEVEQILKDAEACAAIDKTGQHPNLEKLTFDCVEFHTRRFFNFLIYLMQWSGDDTTAFVLLNPDPVSYFYRYFLKYPVFEIGISDSEDLYIAALNADLGGSSTTDTIGMNWVEYVMIPPSKKWFIHGRRDSRSGEGGHLWIQPSLSSKAKEVYPFGLY
jgi:hypothetical protein